LDDASGIAMAYEASPEGMVLSPHRRGSSHHELMPVKTGESNRYPEVMLNVAIENLPFSSMILPAITSRLLSLVKCLDFEHQNWVNLTLKPQRFSPKRAKRSDDLLPWAMTDLGYPAKQNDGILFINLVHTHNTCVTCVYNFICFLRSFTSWKMYKSSHTHIQ